MTDGLPGGEAFFDAAANGDDDRGYRGIAITPGGGEAVCMIVIIVLVQEIDDIAGARATMA